MKTNRAIKEGFKPRPKYPKDRLSAVRFVCPWKRLHIGRCVLILIGLIGDESVSPSVAITRDFTEQGAGEHRLFTKLLTLVPGIRDWYHEHSKGGEITPNVVANRYHKMYYKNKAPRLHRGQISDEHYTVHPCLRPLVPTVEQLFRLKGQITLDELNAIHPGGK